MQFHRNLLAILAMIHVLESTVVAVVIPKPVQTHFDLGSPTISQEQSLDARMLGLRFFRRKVAQAAFYDDWNHVAHVDGRLPDSAYIPKAKRSVQAPFALGSGSEGAEGKRHIFVGKHGLRRSFHGDVLPSVRARRRSSAPTADATNFGIQGIAGTIDIMSPTVDSPVGERIASLSVSTEQSEANQFILNASGMNASTVYLVVKSATPMQDGTLTVALQVPVFDQAKASYVPYCATFDITEASPLTAIKCNEQEVTNHSSQLFSYNSTSGVIKPLWLTSAPLPDMDSPGVAKEEDIASEGQEQPEESDPDSPTPGSSNSTAPAQRNVSLVFTPKLDASTPVVNSQSSQDDSNANAVPSVSSPTSTNSTVVAAMNTRTSSASVSSNLAAEDVGTHSAMPTMCHDSPMEPTPTPLATVAGSAELYGDAEVSPMTEESSMTTSSSSTSLPSESPVATRKRDTDADVDGGDGGEEIDGDEDQPIFQGETSEGGDETKRAVDTGYVWKFSSS